MTVPDDHFLRVVIEAIERLRGGSVQRGHPMLASLLEMAKAEAEDELRTNVQALQRLSEFQEAGVDGALDAALAREVAQLRKH